VTLSSRNVCGKPRPFVRDESIVRTWPPDISTPPKKQDFTMTDETTDESHDNTTAPTDETNDTNTPAPWTKGGPSPNPKGRPKQPKTVREVRDLARQHTVQMVEVLARVASNPKSPPAARQAAASSLLDRAWGKPSGDFEGGEALVIKVVKFAQEQIEDEGNMKLIEGAVVRDDDTTEN
jgi:hypothetical protein